MRDDRERLLDMLEAIRKIEHIVYSEKYTERLQNDELIEVWVIHHLQIIGEAASRISKEFKEQHTDVAWGSMVGMRHVLVHGYFETDTEIVWNVVEKDLPDLKKRLEVILAGQT
jgi:uncharacterized protein with HEPN domain